MFAHSVSVPENASSEWLAAIPAAPAVFALFGPDANSEPYIAKSANLRKRLHRLLTPAQPGSKRLSLAGRIARMEYSEAAAPFITVLLLVQATRQYCGVHAQKRLRLRPPSLIRFAAENPYPRAYVTNRLTQKTLACTYGPFAGRTAAERFLDDSLNFFELRRCTEDLNPDPAFPGCVYSEMKMCLAPCFRGCTEERYAEEAARVREYLTTRGQSEITALEQAREAASAELDFERAAQLHQRIEKMRAAAQQAAPLVHAIADLDAVIVQPLAARTHAPESGAVEKLSDRPLETEGEHVAIFLVRGGAIFGPALFSVAGMRHPNERAGSTSLFSHPTLVAPMPLEPVPARQIKDKLSRNELEQRLETVLNALEEQARSSKPSLEQRAEHLSLLARWYYRPPARRIGEIFFREPTKMEFPLARILRGISRVYCGQRDPALTDAVAAAGTGPR